MVRSLLADPKAIPANPFLSLVTQTRALCRSGVVRADPERNGLVEGRPGLFSPSARRSLGLVSSLARLLEYADLEHLEGIAADDTFRALLTDLEPTATVVKLIGSLSGPLVFGGKRGLLPCPGRACKVWQILVVRGATREGAELIFEGAVAARLRALEAALPSLVMAPRAPKGSLVVPFCCCPGLEEAPPRAPSASAAMVHGELEFVFVWFDEKGGELRPQGAVGLAPVREVLFWGAANAELALKAFGGAEAVRGSPIATAALPRAVRLADAGDPEAAAIAAFCGSEDAVAPNLAALVARIGDPSSLSARLSPLASLAQALSAIPQSAVAEGRRRLALAGAVQQLHLAIKQTVSQFSRDPSLVSLDGPIRARAMAAVKGSASLPSTASAPRSETADLLWLSAVLSCVAASSARGATDDSAELAALMDTSRIAYDLPAQPRAPQRTLDLGRLRDGLARLVPAAHIDAGAYLAYAVDSGLEHALRVIIQDHMEEGGASPSWPSVAARLMARAVEAEMLSLGPDKHLLQRALNHVARCDPGLQIFASSPRSTVPCVYGTYAAVAVADAAFVHKVAASPNLSVLVECLSQSAVGGLHAPIAHSVSFYGDVGRCPAISPALCQVELGDLVVVADSALRRASETFVASIVSRLRQAQGQCAIALEAVHVGASKRFSAAELEGPAFERCVVEAVLAGTRVWSVSICQVFPESGLLEVIVHHGLLLAPPSGSGDPVSHLARAHLARHVVEGLYLTHDAAVRGLCELFPGETFHPLNLGRSTTLGLLEILAAEAKTALRSGDLFAIAEVLLDEALLRADHAVLPAVARLFSVRAGSYQTMRAAAALERACALQTLQQESPALRDWAKSAAAVVAAKALVATSTPEALLVLPVVDLQTKALLAAPGAPNLATKQGAPTLSKVKALLEAQNAAIASLASAVAPGNLTHRATELSQGRQPQMSIPSSLVNAPQWS
jgi:hypothetical protein